MKPLLLFLLISLYTIPSYTQNQPQQYTIRATVMAEQTNEVLAYANVYNQQQAIGTATNLEGYFELPNNHLGDTIVVSYLGYQEVVFVVGSTPVKIIKLSPNSNSLSEVIVASSSDYLYDMLAKVKRNRKSKTQTAKTYFYLETFLNQEQAEVIEAYYNGTYSNYCIDKLAYKKGRIGLKAINNRYFSSTESSKLFSLHDIFTKSDFFPDNPLCLLKQASKKHYDLHLNYTYEQHGSTIYVIGFSPKTKSKQLFSGTVWVSANNHQLIKINLKINHASIHPFLLIGHNNFKQVDLAITKSYTTVQGQLYVDKIHFNYGLSYTDKSNKSSKIQTKAFLKAYDYKHEFILPFFSFTKHFHEDYRNFTASPYDSIFWNNSTEFRFFDRIKTVETFIADNLVDHAKFYPQHSQKLYQLEFTYIQWSKNRVKMGQVSPETIERAMQTYFETDRFHFNTKLYLDINIIQDSLTYQLATILDPIKTYYLFKLEKEDHAFINMYFDLLEIQKRKLETELSQIPKLTLNTITDLYQKHWQAYEETQKLFVHETNRGYNSKKMNQWNDYISKHLDINNKVFFSLTK